jgi:heme oxygenase
MRHGPLFHFTMRRSKQPAALRMLDTLTQHARPARRLALLRSRTGALHASIERVPAMTRLLAPDLSVAEYAVVLQAMHAFHAALEPVVSAELCGHPVSALLDGGRIAALSLDLGWLGVAAVPARPALPRLDGAAAALGALYVIEGASLGGRVIARRVADHLGVIMGFGGSFYGGVSAEMARRRWGLLTAALDGASGDGAFDEQMVAGACGTFRCLEAWLVQAGPGSSETVQLHRVGCDAER